MTDLKTLPLTNLHLSYGAKMGAFAGYNMPLNYSLGVMKEHLQTRESVGLFDVSHMGQIWIHPAAAHSYEDIALAVEALMPIDCLGLKDGRQRYGLLMTSEGGIIDDLMIARHGNSLFLVVNAAGKEADLAHLEAHLGAACKIEIHTDRALLAIQGPSAEAACTSALGSDVAAAICGMTFMDAKTVTWRDETLWITRSGYTGEDGFEISIPNSHSEMLAAALCAEDIVELVGLGARDSLRLEAGLCLYGHDLTTEISPIEAGLVWAIPPCRRSGGARVGGFPGANRVLDELKHGVSRKRVGLLPDGRAPMREGVKLFASASSDEPIGEITSGGFAPSLQKPVSMGYIAAEYAQPNLRVWGDVRGKRLEAKIAAIPFVKPNFKRKST